MSSVGSGQLGANYRTSRGEDPPLAVALSSLYVLSSFQPVAPQKALVT